MGNNIRYHLVRTQMLGVGFVLFFFTQCCIIFFHKTADTCIVAFYTEVIGMSKTEKRKGVFKTKGTVWEKTLRCEETKGLCVY